MGHKVIDNIIKNAFYRLGYCAGKRPGYFIIVPILLAALCMTGLQRMNHTYNYEYLLSPQNGEAKQHRKIMEDVFPMNYSMFTPRRISQPGTFARIILTAKDNGSIIRSHIWDQLIYVDQIVYNTSILVRDSENQKDKIYDYADLCATLNGYCYDNAILRLSEDIPLIEAGIKSLNWPAYLMTEEILHLPIYFGGVEISNDSTLTDVKAVSLLYFLDSSDETKINMGLEWELQLIKNMEHLTSELAPDLSIYKFTSDTPNWELVAARDKIMPTLYINIGLMLIFCFIVCTNIDAVKSKPYLGISGIFCAGLATGSGFGLCCYIGIDYISLNLAAVFLIFGIGVDDTFVMLSAWRRTSPYKSVEERLAITYSEAAVSITVTSLTNFFSFATGILTPFPSVQIFCTYIAISVAFLYLWQLTLFGGFMALSGQREAANRHAHFPCLKVSPKSESDHRSWFYRTFFAGGISHNNPHHHPLDDRKHAGMVFFRDQIGTLLSYKSVKYAVMFGFLVYISVALWGLSNLKEGMKRQETVTFNSYAEDYYDVEDKYFDTSYTVNVLVTGDILYSNPKTQSMLEELMQTFERSSYVNSFYSVSWLRSYLDFKKRNYDHNKLVHAKTEEEFISALRFNYLDDENNEESLDVKFNVDHTRIVASRFFIQGTGIINNKIEQDFVLEIRKISQEFGEAHNIEVTVFNPFFIYTDQYLAIVPQTIQSISITSAIMILISLIFIPSFICAVWVSFSIISIEIGVIGYMSLWGVSLNGIALINLIMCIGFSVDFSAHICYHYVTDTSNSDKERIRNSMYALGIPILQGGISTVLSVCALAFAPAYMFITFFKMSFLVIIFGMLHGLVILPILLSLFDFRWHRSKSHLITINNQVTDPKLDTSLATSSPGGISERTTSCYTINFDHQQNHSLNNDVKKPMKDVTAVIPQESSSKGDKSSFDNSVQFSGNKSLCTVVNKVDSVNIWTKDNKDNSVINQTTELDKNTNEAMIDSRRKTSPTTEQKLSTSMTVKRNVTMEDWHAHRRISLQTPPSGYKKEVSKSISIQPSMFSPQSNNVNQKKKKQSKDENSTAQVEPVHPILRKYNSFPYQVFCNDTGYSSDESLRSTVDNTPVIEHL